MMVQEKTNHQFVFTTSSVLPGTVNPSNPDETIMPAIHIFFPPSFELDTENLASDAVQVSGDGLVINGSPEFILDNSPTYQPDCQLEEYLCFLITWDMDMDLAADSRVTVETSNLKNPESIEIATDVEITTLMKYTQDL